MTYQETLEWMYTQLPMYHRVGQAAYKTDLDNSIELDEHFGHPHKKYITIHIAGTNGKGSVAHMIASILQESSYRTGLYTSPHLIDFRERIKIDGKMIERSYITDFIEKNSSLFKSLNPSFFEMTVAMAFKWFAEQEVEIAVVETGLGGRLDSTNIITPVISIITNISLDHTGLLGDTIGKIATEKAGIIKQNIPIVIGTKDPESAAVFEKRAHELSAPIRFASEEWHVTPVKGGFNLQNREGITFNNLKPELKGGYQQKNIPTVLESIVTLQHNGYTIPERAIYDGIAKTIKNTALFGRWQVVAQHPFTVCDIAHNPDGIREAMREVTNHHYRKLHMIIGVSNDKDFTSILRLLPKEAIYYFTKASIPRALDETILKTNGVAAGIIGESYPSVELAYTAAKRDANQDDMIYIGGSAFIVADLLKSIQKRTL